MTEGSRFDRPTPGGSAAAAAAAAGSAALTALLGPDAALLAVAGAAGAGPVVQSAVNALGRWGERFRSRAGRTVQVAADEAGLQPEELVVAAEASLQKAALLAEALVAAGRSVTEEKIAALGRSLVAGVLTDDEAVVGAERVVVAALADLEPLHLAALSVLRGVPERVTVEEAVRGDQAAMGWSPEDLVEQLPAAAAVADAVLATLVRHGLVRDVGSSTWNAIPNSRYATTDFAGLCLERLGLVAASE